MTRPLVLLAAAAMLSGCAVLDFHRPDPRAQVAALAAAHRDRAMALETAGRLRRALDEWKIARTIDPDDAAAREGQARLEARIERLIGERIAESNAALARGAHLEARRKLLAVLALDPGNRTAFDLLRARARYVDYVVHTVRNGDTLVSLAERYYGDRARADVIGESNGLSPGAPLTPGQALKIPALAGVPLVNGASAATPAGPGQGVPVPAGRDEVDVNPQLAEARDAFERAEYAVALADVERVLAGDPRNREALDFKKLVLYHHAKSLADRKQYGEAYRALGELSRQQSNYEDVAALLATMKREAIEHHYREGIRHYRDERLEEAIAEWRTVLALEPRHPSARKNLEQAQRLLQSLAQRRKK